MRGKEMLDAVGYVGEELILKAETAAKEKKRISLRRAVVLAAAALLLLGATAATAAVIRNRMNVQDVPGGHMMGFQAEEGYLILSEEAQRELLAAREPDRPMCHMYFDTIAEWQAFFGLPYVGEPGLDLTEKVNTEGMNPDAVIEVLVPVGDTEDGPRLGLMVTLIPNGPEIYVPMSAECAADGGVYMQPANANGEIEQEIEEYTTPSGIPCVLVRRSGPGRYWDAELYYGYGSVVYHRNVRLTGYSSNDPQLVEDVKAFADSLTVYMPE